MTRTVAPGARSGSIRIPASKSQAHRLLICAALGKAPVQLVLDGFSDDILATLHCLRALGADIAQTDTGLTVTPIRRVPSGLCTLPCRESGSTLRFLLPVCGLLGADAVFLREGRLAERPLAPLDAQLTQHGMTLRADGAKLSCSGRLRPGDYALPGNISSQYITGLLLALPLLPGDSTLAVTGKRESEGYIAMTEDALAESGVRFIKSRAGYDIPGGQTYALPGETEIEGDYSSAAFFLCMGALSRGGITVSGLRAASSQGDRAVLDILRMMGASVEETAAGVSVRRGALRGCVIDAAPVPDLIPALCSLAAACEGETHVVNAARLRLKESDRLATSAAMLSALGADVTELPDGLIVRGGTLRGGAVSAFGDHRIAMAAAVAACACKAPVEIDGWECTAKSYPRFREDFEALTKEETP
mgnify:CR=1 FL=1